MNGTPKHTPDKTDSLPPMLDYSPPLSDCDLPSLIADPPHVEDILPPPPEFAFSAPPEFANPGPQKDAAVGVADVFDEILASTSNSTLVPDHEDSLERLILETEHHNERDSSSSSSSPSSHRQNKHSWSVIHHQKVKERVGGGYKSEDDPVPSVVGIATEGWSRAAEGVPSRRARSLPSEYSGLPDDGRFVGEEASRRTLSVATSPHYKQSMEMALLEGNLMDAVPPPRNQSLSHSSRNITTSQSSHAKGRRSHTAQHTDPRTGLNSGHQDTSTRDTGLHAGTHKKDRGANAGPRDTHARDRRQTSSSSQDSCTGDSVLSSQESATSLALRRIPSRPAPPPPIPTHVAKVRDKLSSDERQLLPLLYPSGGKPHMMKPVIHDTEKHIQEMLTELDSESRSKMVNTASYGKAAVTGL